MTLPLNEACCASFPAAAFPTVAALRVRADVVGLTQDERGWVWWQPGDAEALNAVLAVPGVAVYVYRDGQWFRPGLRLPDFSVPDRHAARPLYHLLTPERITPTVAEPCAGKRSTLRLVRDDRARGATTMCCRLGDLGRWAESATTAQLSALRAARCGEDVVLLGRRLPA